MQSGRPGNSLPHQALMPRYGLAIAGTDGAGEEDGANVDIRAWVAGRPELRGEVDRPEGLREAENPGVGC
jgi:hypothetical protein